MCQESHHSAKASIRSRSRRATVTPPASRRALESRPVGSKAVFHVKHPLLVSRGPATLRPTTSFSAATCSTRARNTDPRSDLGCEFEKLVSRLARPSVEMVCCARNGKDLPFHVRHSLLVSRGAASVHASTSCDATVASKPLSSTGPGSQQRCKSTRLAMRPTRRIAKGVSYVTNGSDL